MKKIIIPVVILSLSFGCSQKAQDESEKAAESAADSLDDVAKIIRTVKETTDKVNQIGTTINNIKGLEITEDNPVWEYKVVTMTKATTVSTENELNLLGQDGWELATRLEPCFFPCLDMEIPLLGSRILTRFNFLKNKKKIRTIFMNFVFLSNLSTRKMKSSENSKTGVENSKKVKLARSATVKNLRFQIVRSQENE